MLREVAENVLRRERIVVLSGLAAITALSWVYVLSDLGDAEHGDGSRDDHAQDAGLGRR